MFPSRSDYSLPPPFSSCSLTPAIVSFPLYFCCSFHHLRSSTCVPIPCLNQAPFRRSPVVFFVVLLSYSPSLAVIFSIERLPFSLLRLFRRPLVLLLHLGRKLKTIYHRIKELISAISSTIVASASSRLFLQPLRLQLLMSETINLEENEPIDLEENENLSRKYKDRAPCWDEFDKFTDKHGVLRSKCNHCGRGQYKCEKKDYDIFTIRTLLEDAINDIDLCDIAMTMKVKFYKYFGDVEKMNLLFYFSLILDPRNKVKYLVILLDYRYGSHSQGSQGRNVVVDVKKKYIMDSMYELYNDHIRIHSPRSTSSTTESTTSSSVLGKRQNLDAMPPLRNKIREKMKTNIVESIGDLERYLNESVEDDSSMFNILDWWKVNSPRFPILSLMARDLFAIPVSTVASESVFSTSGRILDPYRSSVTDKMIQNLICTQDWLRGGISDNIGNEEDWDALEELEKCCSLLIIILTCVHL
ncbi:hypothetical protein LXL04_019447 [Taraxacum kok-saghyz]